MGNKNMKVGPGNCMSYVILLYGGDISRILLDP